VARGQGVSRLARGVQVEVAAPRAGEQVRPCVLPMAGGAASGWGRPGGRVRERRFIYVGLGMVAGLG
jgi:hypothetical protein